MSEATGLVLTPMPKGELKDQETSWKNVSISATMRTVIKQMLGREKTLHLNNPMLNFIKSEEYKKIIVRRCGWNFLLKKSDNELNTQPFNNSPNLNNIEE